MGEVKEKKTSPSEWFEGLKQEFAKIEWPKPAMIGRQTVVVIVLSIILGVIITILDLFVQQGVNFLVNL